VIVLWYHILIFWDCMVEGSTFSIICDNHHHWDPLGSGRICLDVDSLNCTVCLIAISLHSLPMPRFHQGLQCGT
jgi:hypothetical protein